MGKFADDKATLRGLANRYAEIAALGVQAERIERYNRTIALEDPRPVLLIDEVPWGEIDDDSLVNRCGEAEHRSLEQQLRRALYQWDHFPADMVFPPVFGVAKRIHSTGIGLEIRETLIESDTGTYAASHEYVDQLETDDDLEKLELPVITHDEEATERTVSVAGEAFAGLMEVEAVGTTFQYNIWDRIATYRGVGKLLLDLATRPAFMHRTARRFAEVAAAMVRQLLDHDLLDTHPYILHCTPACARELPAEDFAGTVRLKDVWGRCSAQIFSAVSPDMHDEFDLQYSEKLFGGCGLVYYGCCEPMDRKVDILRKRFPTLRKISITPWADPEMAAASIHGDFVLAAKPNPAFVSTHTFHPEPVEQEMRGVLDACKRNGTTCEFVLKDISTIARNPDNLRRWADTAAGVIDEYYPA